MATALRAKAAAVGWKKHRDFGRSLKNVEPLRESYPIHKVSYPGPLLARCTCCLSCRRSDKSFGRRERAPPPPGRPDSAETNGLNIVGTGFAAHGLPEPFMRFLKLRAK